ncbi:DNA-3-methyladenine glycosylase [Actinidia chinensis var. chinensis]|uniref:DNA-3-methyladenine glycosylase n=1 Tax=Actinidia chinensis var. chinensis TaxID=1590841 RepID=A0A2R6PBP4_ACTCC|nr:DNA-3-methyladenine glycosylase [Actinidia chinensis var. chinensis]
MKKMKNEEESVVVAVEEHNIIIGESDINECGNDDDVVVLELALGECASTFRLEAAVCNHGFFMMAPNVWIPSTKTLQRPLRLLNPNSHHSRTTPTSLTVSIFHPPPPTCSLFIRVHGTHHLSPLHRQAILAQVGRMLRISEKDEKEVQEFQELHPQAKQRGFGRLFRSPTLFEDAVKSILLCNCTWTRSLDMAKALCVLQQELANGMVQNSNEGDLNTNTANGSERVKRKRSTKTSNEIKIESTLVEFGGKYSKSHVGDFPTAKELANLSEEFLEKTCNLGYRARCILKFAKSVDSNRLKLQELENMASSDKLYKALMKVKGFGPFACSNVLMCMGFYERIPQDSETIRHLSQYHARKNCNKRTSGAIIKDIYGKYAPFQCLAYWFELSEYYESKFGRLSKLPSSSYSIVTGSIAKNTHKPN